MVLLSAEHHVFLDQGKFLGGEVGDVVVGVGRHRRVDGLAALGELFHVGALFSRDVEAHAVDEHDVVGVQFFHVLCRYIAERNHRVVVGLREALQGNGLEIDEGNLRAAEPDGIAFNQREEQDEAPQHLEDAAARPAYGLEKVENIAFHFEVVGMNGCSVFPVFQSRTDVD